MAAVIANETPPYSDEEPVMGDHEITLWISDEESEVSDDDELILSVVRDQLKEQARRDKRERGKKPLPRWKNCDSELDIRGYFDQYTVEDNGPSHQKEDDQGLVDGCDEPLAWTHNFNTFTGTPYPFTGTPGPTIDSTDPITIFTTIWDQNIMNKIAQETNRYARKMAELQENDEKPEKNITVTWVDTNAEELYVYFSLLIFVSLHKLRVEEYWMRGNNLTIPSFPAIMKLERFQGLSRCLHFVDNAKIPETDRLLGKIRPIMEHCNNMFMALYQPRQFMDFDDSFLLSKEGTGYEIRKHSNRIGVRTYELSEVFTGYILKIVQHPGKDIRLNTKGKAEIVLDMVKEYANRGHRIVTDKYFSSVYLARQLKAKGFDCVLEVRKNRKDLPEIIQHLDQDERDPELYMYKGNRVRTVSRHCGDISIVAWSEWDITAISTYHSSAMRSSKRGVRRPALTLDYFKVKEKISEKDQDLIDYVMLKKTAERWYVNQFKLLLNISIRNCYIIYKSNSRNNRCFSQVAFRHKVANQLLEHFGSPEVVQRARALNREERNRNNGNPRDPSEQDSDESNECSMM